MARSRYPQDRLWSFLTKVTAVTVLFFVLHNSGHAQTLSKSDREIGHQMLDQIKEDLKNNYYDLSYHGRDLDAGFKVASGMLDRATSTGQVMGIIAQALIGLDDSHTFFIPPMLTAHVDYGWKMQMIGDAGYVVNVDHGRDAEKAGLKVGDRVLSIDGIVPTRETLWKLEYLYNALRPQLGMRLLVQSPSEQPRQIDAKAQVWQDSRMASFWGSFHRINPDYLKEVKHERELRKDRVFEIENDLVIWKLPNFGLPDDRIDDAMKKIRKHKSLVLDLRGNPGGYIRTLKLVLGNFFDHDIKIADRKTRKKLEPEIAKGRGSDVFKGELVVLVDSESASAAELFARVIQLEKRGTVLGDRTTGAVMESLRYFHNTGTSGPGISTRVDYAVSITVADLIMTDGKSLERKGVTPDEVLQPTSADLFAKRDVVLSRAAKLLGVSLDPERAGAILNIERDK